MAGDEQLAGKENLQKVEELWGRTFDFSNKIMQQVQQLGFARLGEMKTPNIEEMLITLQMLNAVFDVLGAHADDNAEARLLLNAKQQILLMEILVSAWKAGDKHEFDRAVEQLERQAQI